MNINQLILLFFALTLIISCKTDTINYSKEDITANWLIVKAERNGTQTSTLENAFFHINENEIAHNLNGDTVRSNYIYETNKLVIQDDLLKNMEIIDLVNDTLNTKTKINNFRFEFTMVKNEE